MQRTALFLTVILILSSAPSRAGEATFDSLYNQMKSALLAACELHPDCVRRVTSFAWFLWNNRDKADIQYNTMKCLGYSAVKRGYVWSPTKIFDDLNPVTAQEVAIEVCDCVVGYWGKGQACPVPEGKLPSNAR